MISQSRTARRKESQELKAILFDFLTQVFPNGREVRLEERRPRWWDLGPRLQG